MHGHILIELNTITHYHGPDIDGILKVTGLKVKVTDNISQNALFRRRHIEYYRSTVHNVWYTYGMKGT